jgi:hypothetical protein
MEAFVEVCPLPLSCGPHYQRFSKSSGKFGKFRKNSASTLSNKGVKLLNYMLVTLVNSDKCRQRA